MAASFVHLHLHTEYSIEDSVIRIPELMAAVRNANMPAVALTDQNNVFGMVKFYTMALEAGVKPILGADVWFRLKPESRAPARLLLLCKSNQGYQMLSRLLTRAYVDTQENGLPVIQADWLGSSGFEGLIGLSGGREGVLGPLLLAGRVDQAKPILETFRRLFHGDFFIELQRTGRAQENDYIANALRLASQTGCPVVATNDVRFLEAADFEVHEARLCIHQGWALQAAERPRLFGEAQFLRNAAQMQELFADIPAALENTVEIAKRCNVQLSFEKRYLPEFTVPEGRTPEEMLIHQAEQGLQSRFASRSISEELRSAYDSRLKYELEVICRMGFAGYYLIVADFVRWARDNDIPVGPGRGSGVSSLVAYSLRITELDPLRYGLLFERFLNPERVSMPDFDIDFCAEGRDRVIEYVTTKYGGDRVAQIVTYGTLAARAAVRDAGRVLGLPRGLVDRVAKLIPGAVGITLSEALEQESELRALYETNDDVRSVVDLAKRLEGLVRNAGTHAGGVVIAPSDITAFTPLYRVPGQAANLTQFDMKDVERVGLVKFDFLGLRTLTVIDLALKAINAQRRSNGELALDIAAIELDDKATFELLRSCQTTAVFQLESRGMRDLIKRLRPDSFDDIVAVVALFRPGPLGSDMIDDFISGKHSGGTKRVDYLHPDLESILAETYGVILYQEQVMQIAQRLAGYTLGQADLLRSAMGKKEAGDMAKQRPPFIEGALARNVDMAVASHIFDLMEKFGKYGFNKSHSVAYALLAYQTAWLKAHYPAAFMAACLSCEMEKTDKLKELQRECLRMNLALRPPDINRSHATFTVEDSQAIRYGLGAIKGLGRSAAELIVAERVQGGAFDSLHKFCLRTNASRIGRRALEALIKAGAFDALGHNRPTFLMALAGVMNHADQANWSLDSGQEDLFSRAATVAAAPPTLTERSAWGTRRLLEAEHESLGLYLSGHPFDQYRADSQYLVSASLKNVAEMPPPSTERQVSQSMTLGGLVDDVRKRSNRVFLELDDGVGSITVAVTLDLYERCRHLLEKNKSIILVTGGLRFDPFSDRWTFFARDITNIDDRASRAAVLTIYWKSFGHGDVNAHKLHTLLEPFKPGVCRVCLRYVGNGAEASMTFGADWSVKPTRDLRERLSELFGPEGFRFSYDLNSIG